MRRFVDSARSKQCHKTAISYDDFARLGLLKTYSVRLPLTTIAKLDELQTLLSSRFPTNWRSKQEFLFDLIEHAVNNVIEDDPSQSELRSAVDKVAHRALQRTSAGFDLSLDNS